ncbi:MAG TPA: glycosyltransferase [Bacteroidota bacterium]
MNALHPHISVIMAVRNGERFLREAIETVLQQTLPASEIIVIDGNSTDGTKEIAQSFSNITYVLQTGKGIPNAYNQGIKRATGEFIAFLSHDDRWVPHKLETQIRRMEQEPEILYTICKASFFLDDAKNIPPMFKQNLLEGGHIAPIMETLVARKTVFDIIGMFDEAFTISEDVDWFARCQDAHIPMAVIPEVLLFKRIHADNSSMNAPDSHDLLNALHKSVERKHRKQGDT